MVKNKRTYYPTILQAIHLLILFLFIQSLVDFPLALIDYYKGSNYLNNPIKKIILNTGSTLFIMIYGFLKTKASIKKVFPIKLFNPLIILPVITFLWGAHNILDEINIMIEKLIPTPPWFWELFSKVFENNYGWWGTFMKVAVIAPIIEELIFRGLIFYGLKKNYTSFTAIFISALLFSLYHLNPWQLPATFILGLLLGWIMLRTRNILMVILGHSINNLLVLLSITFWDKINTHAIYLMDKNEKSILSGLIIALSLILIYFFSLWPKNKENK